MISLVLSLLLQAEPTLRAPALRAELLAMKDEDQAVRRAAARGVEAPFAEVTKRHTARLRAIIEEHGWPGRSLVGEDGPKGPPDRGRSAPHTLESAPTLADFPDFRTNPTEIRQRAPG